MLIILFSLIASACGVKGDPLPPERPPSIGRGQPSFKEAAKEIKVPSQPQIVFDEKLEDEDEDEEDEEE